MSFGFSVGDFLAGIKLVHDLAVALSDGRGSGAKFKCLVQELYSLERAMIAIKDFQVPASLESQLGMVQQAASQSQRAITDFLQNSHVYIRYLGQERSPKWLKGAFYKAKWALYKPDSVAELRACLRGHTLAMGIMLQVLQIRCRDWQPGKSPRSTLTSLQTNGHANLSNDTSPDRDSRAGTVSAARVLIYALKPRYSQGGARKVEQGQFAITDVGTNRDINLNREWKRCFRPGQRVNMSFIFNEALYKTTTSTCPGCRAECAAGDENNEIECPNCAMIFRRITALDEPGEADPSNMGARGEQQPNDNLDPDSSRETKAGSVGDQHDNTHLLLGDEEDEDSDDEISEYKCIRLLNHGGNHWNPLECSQTPRISKAGLGVSYHGRPSVERDTPNSTVEATRPLRSAATLSEFSQAYFEIRVLNSGDGCTIGLCSGTAATGLLGTHMSIYSYRGSDGGLWHGPPRSDVGPNFRPGDVVGCGLDKRDVYFVLNGIRVGKCGHQTRMGNQVEQGQIP
ncbi:hypothetical protein C8A00DRAFT_18259 [Chaetomidium leptoderma]|uniref:B30.2/SPRY domain-containing protein n=1 Tax=Chaetomidium leptoderma TaxID=669021 RepID=A0AAN6VG47_9PEZI|nr:hypothetical protein C8A00DRAFT_18259 [Chaetomidium leptoderma]